MAERALVLNLPADGSHSEGKEHLHTTDPPNPTAGTRSAWTCTPVLLGYEKAESLRSGQLRLRRSPNGYGYEQIPGYGHLP